MCLMCEEEDLYFLYLERMEREKRAARGEIAPPDANWLWRTAPAGQPAAAAKAASDAPRGDSRFACDSPEPE
jgi:hypothetical protein